MQKRTALLEWPRNDYITLSLRRAFAAVLPAWSVVEQSEQLQGRNPDLQFSDYDLLDWDTGMQRGNMLSSYVIRKSSVPLHFQLLLKIKCILLLALHFVTRTDGLMVTNRLIRKNHLSHTISLYLAKNPTSILSSTIPKSSLFSLSFPDELDELLLDDLYELNESFLKNEEKEAGERKWFILKPALADRGNGIRLFSSREELEGIFEEFQEDSDDEEEEEEEGKNTTVNASQMREWVVQVRPSSLTRHSLTLRPQEYLSKPLLLDPLPSRNEVPTKFHLRVYVVAVGALKVYVHHPFLALFAPTAYEFPPTTTESGSINIAPHLTNTCLQSPSLPSSEIVVTTLPSLTTHEILAGPNKGTKFTLEQVAMIESAVGEVVAETFRAGVSSGSGFQCLPNVFEIFGVDFLVDERFEVSLLEINAVRLLPLYNRTHLADVA